MIARTLRRIRYELRCILAASPALNLPLAQRKRTDACGAKPVRRDSELVIEAFPRSGNALAVFAPIRSQDRVVDLAYHFHALAQLIAAARWRRPALLIVRPPADAVHSLVLREPQISPRQALPSWRRFHEPLLPHVDAFVVTTFDQVTSDFGAVVRRINARFGTGFAPFVHGADNIAACFEAIEARSAQRFGGGAVVETGVARPSTIRRAQKGQIVEELRAVRLASALTHAESIYGELAKAAVTKAVDGAPAGRTATGG